LKTLGDVLRCVPVALVLGAVPALALGLFTAWWDPIGHQWAAFSLTRYGHGVVRTAGSYLPILGLLTATAVAVGGPDYPALGRTGRAAALGALCGLAMGLATWALTWACMGHVAPGFTATALVGPGLGALLGAGVSRDSQ
jgi:hypothetical protein